MRVGGEGHDRWIVALPVGALVVVATVLLGGPEETLSALEHSFLAAWDAASVLFGR